MNRPQDDHLHFCNPASMIRTPFSWRSFHSAQIRLKAGVLYLFVEEVEGELQPDCLHVGLLERGGDVHVHVQEPLHRAAHLRLLDLQLRQQVHEPLERSLHEQNKYRHDGNVVG